MTNELAYTCVKDIRHGLKNLNVQFIVLDVGKPTRTKDGHNVRSCKVADRTGCINISIWDDAGDLLQSGDICRLTKGYGSLFKGCLTLYAGKGGDILKIGEFCMLYTELPNLSEPTSEYIVKLEQEQQKQQNPGLPQSRTDPFQPVSGGSTATPIQNQSQPMDLFSPPAQLSPVTRNPPGAVVPLLSGNLGVRPPTTTLTQAAYNSIDAPRRPPPTRPQQSTPTLSNNGISPLVPPPCPPFQPNSRGKRAGGRDNH